MDAELIFDGGSRGNPGQAFGSFRLRYGRGRLTTPVRQRFGRATNNQAEYLSLIAGVEALLAQLGDEGVDPGSVRLRIRGDSQLVLSQLEGKWKVKNAVLKALHQRAQELLSAFGEVSFVHQPRRATIRALGH